MCGIFGITNKNALNSLMSGFLPFSTGAGVRGYRGGRRRPPAGRSSMGLVSRSLKDELDKLKGRNAIDHIRYYHRLERYQNAQPLFFNSSLGALAVAHNII